MAGGEVEPDAFENPTEDFEVCFVAGTQVLLADGSTKPIEQIRPGDKVLSSHHLTPEETPTSANVVRFFDNGEKEVVRLRFTAQETPIDATSQLAHDAASPQEIVCTPGHRFYVVGKGWVSAQDLQPGDLALSATGEKIAFVSRENLAEKRRVYNFEVEGKHTYFVGKNIHFLVHNFCFGDKEFVMPWDPQAETNIVKNFQYWGDAVRNFTLGSEEMHARNEEKLLERGLNPLSTVNDVMGENIVTHGPLTLAHRPVALPHKPVTLKTKHIEIREKLNREEEFYTLTKDFLMRLWQKGYIIDEKNFVLEERFLNEIWIPLSDGERIYHSLSGDGWDCVKWQSLTAGREIVIRYDGTLSSDEQENISGINKDLLIIEDRPELKGTFNYGTSGWADHFMYDILPYWIWGNSDDDSTPFLSRIYPKLFKR